MDWNLHAFLAINLAERPTAASLLMLRVLAVLPPIVAPAMLGLLWIKGPAARRPALIATGLGLFVGQGINLLLGQVWYEPRPFMAGIGHGWIAHAADNSFPSDHTTLAFSLGLGVLLTGAGWRWASAACAMAILTGLARVALGVHFPIDIVVSLPAGLLAAAVARAMLPVVRRWIAPLAERVYGQMLGKQGRSFSEEKEPKRLS